MLYTLFRYHNEANEPDSSNRTIVFRVFDNGLNSSSSLSLAIAPKDDNPTTISLSGSGTYSYMEGQSPVQLTGVVLRDDDSVNSDVMVAGVTLEVIGGSANEILQFTSSFINVS